MPAAAENHGIPSRSGSSRPSAMQPAHRMPRKPQSRAEKLEARVASAKELDQLLSAEPEPSMIAELDKEVALLHGRAFWHDFQNGIAGRVVGFHHGANFGDVKGLDLASLRHGKLEALTRVAIVNGPRECGLRYDRVLSVYAKGARLRGVSG